MKKFKSMAMVLGSIKSLNNEITNTNEVFNKNPKAQSLNQYGINAKLKRNFQNFFVLQNVIF
jgi:hypothetical protein